MQLGEVLQFAEYAALELDNATIRDVEHSHLTEDRRILKHFARHILRISSQDLQLYFA